MKRQYGKRTVLTGKKARTVLGEVPGPGDAAWRGKARNRTGRGALAGRRSSKFCGLLAIILYHSYGVL